MKQTDKQLKTRLNNSMFFEVKCLGATNHRGSRVKVISYDLAHRNNEKPKSITLSYDHTFNSSTDIGQYWLETQGFELLAKNCNLPDKDIFICKWDWSKLCKAYDIAEVITNE